MYRKILSWLLTLAIIFTMIGGANISASGLEFVDVEEHWAKAEIENWTEKGIINGYKDGTFKPNDNITRAEFITLINKVINIQGEEEISFEDINGGEWYYSELKKAIYGEYIGGYEDNTFRANDNITRQEVAVILQNLVQLQGNEESELEKFTDTEDIPTWSRAALNLAVQKGYLTGYADNSLKALNYITRAESVMVLSNVFGTIYNEPGVYGPGLDEEVLQVKGNVTVSVEDVTLQNMTIDGDLYLAEGIGEGDVILDSITVKGDTIVKGGGENSIIIKNSSLENLLVIKKDGIIRIVAQGSTSIGKTYLYSSAKLQGERLNKESFGDLEIIRVTPGEKIELEGSFTKIDVKVPSEIQVNGKSKVEEINVHENTEDVSIFVSAYSIIDKIYVYTEIKVDNRGIITEALGDFKKTSIYENRLPLNLQPKTSSSSRPSVDKYTLTLNSNIDNGGSLSGSGSYEADTNITISAIAYEGYEFIEWKEGEDQITTAASFGYTTTDEDKTFTAYFESTSEFEGGSGTESDPYLVANADQLDKVRNYLDAHFKQVADIDLGVSPWNDGEGWEPIGTSENPFAGGYDGQEFSISNLKIIKPSQSTIGLFGKTDMTSTIKNIIIKDFLIEGYSEVGTLIGYNTGEVSNVHIDGLQNSSIKAYNYYAGGLCGVNQGTITYSSTKDINSISNNESYTGGLVGRSYPLSDYNTGEIIQQTIINNSYADNVFIYGKGYSGGLIGGNTSEKIENCWANATVEGTHRVGGLIGMNSSDVYRSYSLGKVTGTDISNGMTGGLIGYSMNYFKIENCYSLAEVQGPYQVGGLIGRTASYVTNCYSAGKVVGTDNKNEIGGLLGNAASIIEVKNSYWDTETSGIGTSAGGAGVTGYVTSAMIISTNSVPIYEGWDFDTIWNIDTGTSYPYLRNNEQIPHPKPYDFIVYNQEQYNDTVNQNGSSNYLLNTGPSLGTLVFNLDGSFSYTSNQSDSGLIDTDFFSYTVDGSDPVYVKIKILPSRR